MFTPSETLVLVTGGSGFLGAHCIISLLTAGYKVRTTVRSPNKQSTVRDMLKNGNISDSLLSNLSFALADLTNDDGWPEAVSGCTYVLHVASPFPAYVPKHEDDLIIPAREGTLRVLRAAKAAGVKRVVLTSSFTAVGYGHPEQDKPFTEENWTDLSHGNVGPYPKSKTLAERAAWDFIKSEDGKGLEMSVINPVGIFGPVLGKEYATSIIFVERLLKGDFPGVPKIWSAVVDVRDVASLHLLAMTHEKAAGERFLAVSPPTMSIQETAMTLKERLPDIAKRAPTRVFPNILVRIVALFNKEVALVVPELGKKKEVSNEKARMMLGWNPRSREDALVATVESLVKFGILKKSSQN
jgi:nucleoside-diphosphate-sugar epimerase